MTQGESKRSRDIRQAMEVDGYFCFKIHGGAYMLKGLPDLIVCAEGLFIGLETKTAETRSKDTATRRRQEYIHDKIRLAGGRAYFVTTVEEAREAVESVLAAYGSGAAGR